MASQQNGKGTGSQTPQGHDCNAHEELGMAELTDSHRDQCHDHDCERGACACNGAEQEATEVKSVDPESMLRRGPPLSPNPQVDGGRSLSADGPAASDARRAGQPLSDFGLQSRELATHFASAAVSVGDMENDYSLHSRNQPSGLDSTVTVARSDGDAASNCSNSLSRQSSYPAHPANNIGMNILPSMDEPRINNTEVPVAIAERQQSYRTLCTPVSSLSSIQHQRELQVASQQVQPQHYQQQPYVQQWLQQLPQQHQAHTNNEISRITQGQQHRNEAAAVAVSGTITPFFGSPHSNEDNTQNISVSPRIGPGMMTAQAHRGPLNQAPPAGSQANGACPTPQAGRSQNNASTMSSLRSHIPDNCLVRHLPRRIIKHVADRLQCSYASGTWKDLVEMYDWNFEKTELFEHQNHRDGPFFTLLREPEFQHYSLEQLRHDLFHIPRRDVLSSLNELIAQHNENATVSPNSRGANSGGPS